MGKNLIFLTMSRTTADINSRAIYPDLLRKFRNEGYSIFIVMPSERRLSLPTELREQDGVHILGVKTLNLQKTNAIESHCSTSKSLLIWSRVSVV